MKLLLVFLHGMGDCLMLSPALRLYKRAHPSHHLGVMTLDSNLCLFRANPHVSAVFGCRTYEEPLSYGNYLKYARQRWRLRREIGTVANDFRADEVRFLLPHRFSYRKWQLPMPGVVRRTLCRYWDRPETHKLVEALGVKGEATCPDDCRKELYFDRASRDEGEWILRDLNLTDYCVVHPDASTLERSFTEEELHFIVDELQSAGCAVLLLSPEKRRNDVKTAFGSNALVSAVLIERARAFVGVDSGPAHVAEIFDKNMIVIAKLFPFEVLYGSALNRFLFNEFDRHRIKEAVHRVLESTTAQALPDS